MSHDCLVPTFSCVIRGCPIDIELGQAMKGRPATVVALGLGMVQKDSS